MIYISEEVIVKNSQLVVVPKVLWDISVVSRDDLELNKLVT